MPGSERKPIMGGKLGCDICEMLGIEPNVVRRIVLVCDVRQPALVRVTSYATTEDGKRSAEQVVQRYQLVECEPA